MLAHEIVATFCATTTGDHAKSHFTSGLLQATTGKMRRRSLRHPKQNDIGLFRRRFENIAQILKRRILPHADDEVRHRSRCDGTKGLGAIGNPARVF